MAVERVRIGVIGVGALGRHHTRLYREISDAELIGVFDVNQEAAEAIADTFETRAFGSIQSLAEEVDALSIAVPATFHHAVATELLAAGKHLLMEKPLADIVEHAEELVRLADEAGVVLAVGHVERFNPAFRAYLGRKVQPHHIDARREGPYPPPRPGAERRGTDVSVVLDLMVHDIDLVLSLYDAELTGIQATGEALTGGQEDIAFATLYFSDGRAANLVASRVAERTVRTMRVTSSEGLYTIDLGNRTLTCARADDACGIEQTVIPVGDANALKDELANFCRCVHGRLFANRATFPRVDGVAGARAVSVAHEVLREIQKG